MSKDLEKIDTNALATIEDEWAAEAEEFAKSEALSGAGKFLHTRGGIMSWDGNPLPGNAIAAIILDGIVENQYYSAAFDPDEPRFPACYAYGRDEASTTPHPLAPEPQSTTCASCPHNQWGSAKGGKGKGKACSNVRRLALLPAGRLSEDGEWTPPSVSHYASTQLCMLKVPVMSVRLYKTYVNRVAATLKRPPYGVVTKVAIKPDPKSQFVITFEPLAPVDARLAQVLRGRRDEAMAVIDAPYPKREEGMPEPTSTGRKEKF